MMGMVKHQEKEQELSKREKQIMGLMERYRHGQCRALKGTEVLCWTAWSEHLPDPHAHRAGGGQHKVCDEILLLRTGWPP